MATWTVMVGNVGVVHSGKSELDAREVFKKYKIKSLTNEGRAGGEPVVMLKDGEEYSIHETPEVLKNPRKRVKRNPITKAHLTSAVNAVKKGARKAAPAVRKAAKATAAAAKKAAPHIERAASSAKDHLLRLHKSLKKNPPNRAGDMAAFEYDVVGNPPFVMHSVLAKKRAATRNPAEDSVDARALMKKIKDLQRELKEQEAAEKAMKKVVAAAKKTKSRAKPKTKRVPASQLSAKPKKASASQLSTKTKSRAKPKTKFTPEQRAARAEKLALASIKKAIAKAKKSSRNTED